jgi:two-component system, OmpR family, response regulator VicR
MTPPEILIVDDEPGLLRLFTSLIQRLDCTVIEASGGAAALAILEARTPYLLILDIAMPEVSGIDVLTYVIQTPRLDSMNVMVLTALGSNRDFQDLAPRVQRWVSKPVMPIDFLQMVKELLPGDRSEST